MAAQEPAVLNAALAVAASHHSRWQRKADTMSRKYLRAASKALRERFMSPDRIHDPITLASMLLLVSFEVFNADFPFESSILSSPYPTLEVIRTLTKLSGD